LSKLSANNKRYNEIMHAYNIKNLEERVEQLEYDYKYNELENNNDEFTDFDSNQSQ
jgi:hypothetical protein